MQETNEKNEGITLIALVITIVVLLILASVTIATLTGDNGLLQKATTAKQANEEATALEKIQVEVSGSYGLDGKIDIGQLNTNLKRISGLKYKGNTLSDLNKIDVLPVTVELNGYSYVVQSDGNLEKILWVQNKTKVTNIKTGQSLDVGDTVYYNSGIETYEGAENNQGKWAILGVENGEILIISKNNITNVTLKGKDGYVNGSTYLNNACSLYKDGIYADSVRSVNVEDINRITQYIPPNPMKYIYTMEDDKVKRNGQNTSRKAFESPDGTVLTSENSIEVIANYYSCLLTDYLMSESKEFKILNDNSNYFWIDSKYANDGFGYACYGLRSMANRKFENFWVWDSSGIAREISAGVRAVVSLKTNVKLNGDNTNGWTLQ